MDFMLWILFALLAPLVWAIGNILDKYIFARWIKQPMVALMSFGLVGALCALAVFTVKCLRPISATVLAVALLTGLIYLFANLLYFKAIQKEEVSRVIALVYINPLFTAVLSAIFLGEIFGPLKYAGVVCLVLGAMLISYKKQPGLGVNRAFVYCLLAALLFAFYDLFLKYLTNRLDFWAVFAWVRLGTFVALLPAVWFYRRPFGELLKQTRGLLAVASSNLLGQLGILFFTIAASLGFITLTSALSGIQPLLVLLMSLGLGAFLPWFPKEEMGRKVFWQKFSAIVLIFIGALLIIPR